MGNLNQIDSPPTSATDSSFEGNLFQKHLNNVSHRRFQVKNYPEYNLQTEKEKCFKTIEYRNQLDEQVVDNLENRHKLVEFNRIKEKLLDDKVAREQQKLKEEFELDHLNGDGVKGRRFVGGFVFSTFDESNGEDFAFRQVFGILLVPFYLKNFLLQKVPTHRIDNDTRHSKPKTSTVATQTDNYLLMSLLEHLNKTNREQKWNYSTRLTKNSRSKSYNQLNKGKTVNNIFYRNPK